MKINEIQILKYINNELDNHQKQTFESLMAHDEALQAQVQVMRASKLPYDAAFATQKIPDVPENLLQGIEQLSHIASNNIQVNKNTKSTRWLMAACVSLAFIAGSLFTFGIHTWQSQQINNQLSTYDDKKLIDAMIQYQALYTRATVEPVKQSLNDAAVYIDKFNQLNNRQLNIPDLTSQGYEFRRAQELAYQQKTIIQMVYLPRQNKPIALCVTKTHIADQPATYYQYADMSSYIWVKNGVVYMLMGDYEKAELQILLKNILV